jgi:hypothetical protein
LMKRRIGHGVLKVFCNRGGYNFPLDGM